MSVQRFNNVINLTMEYQPSSYPDSYRSLVSQISSLKGKLNTLTLLQNSEIGFGKIPHLLEEEKEELRLLLQIVKKRYESMLEVFSKAELAFLEGLKKGPPPVRPATPQIPSVPPTATVPAVPRVMSTPPIQNQLLMPHLTVSALAVNSKPSPLLEPTRATPILLSQYGTTRVAGEPTVNQQPKPADPMLELLQRVRSLPEEQALEELKKCIGREGQSSDSTLPGQMKRRRQEDAATPEKPKSDETAPSKKSRNEK